MSGRSHCAVLQQLMAATPSEFPNAHPPDTAKCGLFKTLAIAQPAPIIAQEQVLKSGIPGRKEYIAVNAAGKKYQPSAVLIRLRRLTSLLWVFIHAPELLENVYIMVYRDGKVNKIQGLAEREGFEPSIQVLARITV